MKTRMTYEINQGTCRRQSDGTLTNYDLTTTFKTLDKEEALAKFEVLKTDTEGWVHNVVITELVEVQEYFDEEENTWVFDEDYNFTNDTVLDYFECDK